MISHTIWPIPQYNYKPTIKIITIIFYISTCIYINYINSTFKLSIHSFIATQELLTTCNSMLNPLQDSVRDRKTSLTKLRILLSWLRRWLMHWYGVWVVFFYTSSSSECLRHAILLCHSLIGIYAAPRQKGCYIAVSKLDMTRWGPSFHFIVRLLLNGWSPYRNSEGLLMHGVMDP